MLTSLYYDRHSVRGLCWKHYLFIPSLLLPIFQIFGGNLLWNHIKKQRHYFAEVRMLLLLLSHFSRVRLYATAQMAAHLAAPSLGFSRQEHWSGLPLPSPMLESDSEVAQSCPTLRDPMYCSLPGSSVHGIFQARVLEWGAIAFSGYIHYHM